MSASNARTPRVLWVTEERPDHTLGGGSVRQAYLLEAVAREMTVDLLVASNLTDERVRAAAADVMDLNARLAFTPEYSIVRQAHWLAVALASPRPWYAYGAGPRRRALARVLRRRSADYDLVCVEHTALAPVLSARRSGRWVLTMHQLVSSELVQELATGRRRRRRWLLQRDLTKAERMEREAALGYDQVIVCSEADADAVRQLLPGSADLRVAVIPNGVDLTHFRVTPLPSEPRVLFPGSFHFPPNIHGAIWLCNEIWPQVRDAVPGATLELVGREPDERVLALESHPGVRVEADVPSMAPYFERARTVAVPLLVGSGTRLKVVEAMSCARPVVGTSIGLSGLDIVDGQTARVADRPDEFARALIEVLTDDSVAGRLAVAGRKHVEARFGWDRIGRDYVRLLNDLLMSDRADQIKTTR